MLKVVLTIPAVFSAFTGKERTKYLVLTMVVKSKIVAINKESVSGSTQPGSYVLVGLLLPGLGNECIIQPDQFTVPARKTFRF
jgi:hypothetical protein